jgi:hypothetical protein
MIDGLFNIHALLLQITFTKYSTANIPIKEISSNPFSNQPREDSTPALQKPEGFRVKASKGEVVVFYFKPLVTQDLKFSGFPRG